MEFLELFGFFARMDWLVTIVFLSGFALVITEMFVPGFGVPGISGAILLFIGVLLLANSLMDAVIMFIIIVAFLGIILTIVLHSASKGRFSKTVVLNDALNREQGFSGTEDLEFFLGKQGVAVTTLRPSGTADFDGVRLDVVSQSEFISKGTKVTVIKVEGRRIVVDDIEENA